MKLLADFFVGLDRQGPGSQEQTLLALQFIKNLPEDALIADLGCGTGGQTQTLAENLTGSITAVDLLPEMVDGITRRMKCAGFDSRVTAVQGSMDDLSFEDESLDLIWAEGSIYNIGFARGLRQWRNYLKKDGYIAVTETCWFSNQRPADITRIRTDHPEIDDISAKVRVVENAGYKPLAHFILPKDCWWEHFYYPMEKRIEEYRRLHGHQPGVENFLQGMEAEIDYYWENGRYYGYVFFVAQKL